jgi:hypothetical protein
MSNALLDLAWAAMTEKSIVRKLAAQCRARRLTWSRGDKGDIREIINDSRPPRGRKKSRLEAVIEEIPRQSQIAQKRDYNKPIDWSRNKPLGDECFSLNYAVDSRRKRIFDLRAGKTEFTSCSAYMKWHGHHVFLVRRSYYSSRALYILHPDGGVRVIELAGERRQQETIFGAVIHNLGQRDGLLKRAVMTGASIVPDFCLAQTTVTFPDGKRIAFPWEDAEAGENSPHVCASAA